MYNPYPYGYQPQGYGYPQGGYPPEYQQNNNMMTMLMCDQPVGLGGKSQMVPTQYPINLQAVAQQVVMFLMAQGFQAWPMVGQNLAVIQAQHHSLLGTLTDQNKAYTIRLCQGQGFVMVETGIANLMQDLLTAGATVGISDFLLHSKLLTMIGGGVDAYGMYKEYAQEEQLLQTIEMAIMSAPPLQPPPPPYSQTPYQQPYGQPYPQQYPPYQQPYPQQYRPPQYPQQPYQQPPEQPQYQQPPEYRPPAQYPQQPPQQPYPQQYPQEQPQYQQYPAQQPQNAQDTPQQNAQQPPRQKQANSNNS